MSMVSHLPTSSTPKRVNLISIRCGGKIAHSNVPAVRGYPRTFSNCHSKIKQLSSGNETPGDRWERAYSA